MPGPKRRNFDGVNVLILLVACVGIILTVVFQGGGSILQTLVVIDTFGVLMLLGMFMVHLWQGKEYRLVESSARRNVMRPIALTDIDAQRTEYQRAIQIEISNILSMLKDDANRSPMERPKKILSARWDEPTDETKAVLIGINPFHLLKTTYEDLEAINSFLDSNQLLDSGRLRELQRAYLGSLKKSCGEIPWLKSLEGKCEDVMASLQYSV